MVFSLQGRSEKGDDKMKDGQQTKSLAQMALGAALIAVCSWISIPTTVPFTMQTFGVCFVLLLLGGRKGTGSIGVYILLGAVGLPVFSQFTGGLGVLFGNTGGYIVGFLLIGLITWAAERLGARKTWQKMVALLVGLVGLYLFGTVWFLWISTQGGSPVGFQAALGMCVLPFVPFDIAKFILAAVLCRRIRPHLSV